jgi:hypothetical protein
MAEHLVLEIPERGEVDHVPVAASCWTGQELMAVVADSIRVFDWLSRA